MTAFSLNLIQFPVFSVFPVFPPKVPLQFLGHHLPILIRGDLQWNDGRLAVDRLVGRLYLLNRHRCSFQDCLSRWASSIRLPTLQALHWPIGSKKFEIQTKSPNTISFYYETNWPPLKLCPPLENRRRRPANRHQKAATTLHEQHHVLHRLPVSSSVRLSLSIHGIQLNSSMLSSGEDLPFPLISRSNRTTHELPESLSNADAHTLHTDHLPLERIDLPSDLETRRVRHQRLVLLHERRGVQRCAMRLLARLLLVHTGAHLNRRSAQTENEARICVPVSCSLILSTDQWRFSPMIY